MADLDQIYQRLGLIQEELGSLKALTHKPGSCDIAMLVSENTKKVRALELREARRAGGLAAVGIVAGLVASMVTSGIVSVAMWLLYR